MTGSAPPSLRTLCFSGSAYSCGTRDHLSHQVGGARGLQAGVGKQAPNEEVRREAKRGAKPLRARYAPAIGEGTGRLVDSFEIIVPGGFDDYYEAIRRLFLGGAKPGGPEHVEISDRYGLSLSADWIPELKARFGLRMLGEL